MTDDTGRREGGAWIGQHPDENTERVRENLGEGAERVAVTNNQSDTATEATMDHDRQHDDDQATSVDEPSGTPQDADTPYDPAMTEGDEANIPPDSDADPVEGH